MANQFARSLRSNATSAERLLWSQLRLMKTEGRHFRRQVPVGHFVADFACHYPKVIVELDGSQHEVRKDYDTARTQVLNMNGFRVLRFWNADVFDGLEGVVDQIRHAVRLKTLHSYSSSHLHSTPTPALPTRGREQD